MARPYSVDLCERVVRAVEGGASRRATAAKLKVGVSFVVKLLQRWRRCGTVMPDRQGGGRRSPLAPYAERLQALVTAEPALTIAELRERLAVEGVTASRSAIGRRLIACGLTRKKRSSTRPSRIVRMSPRPGAPGASGSRP